jgi:predicted Zn finger-like uncharacterized protein
MELDDAAGNAGVCFMKIFDADCAACAASYEVAEAASVKGGPGEVRCAACGQVLASWDEPKLIAYRLMLSPRHKYLRVPLPPSAND